MSSVILLLMATQAQAQAPLIPAFFTGGQLSEICSRPNGGQCSMYVAGVVDGLFYARSRAGTPALCPSQLNNREAAEVVAHYLVDRPDRHDSAAALVVREALAGRLDCGGPSIAETSGSAPTQ